MAGKTQVNTIHKTEVCAICGRTFPISELVPAAVIRGAVVETIRSFNSDWNGQGFICQVDLARFRGRHVEKILEREIGEVTELEKSVVESLKNHQILSEPEESEALNFGERMADRVAEIGGSWTFIGGFALTLVIWIGINSLELQRPFDPYPYILLNLCLSCLAAVQAPIIMMSQNRREKKDRQRAKNDYIINLKAELEIRHLHEKLDHLLVEQWRSLADIQQQQMAILEDLAARRS